MTRRPALLERAVLFGRTLRDIGLRVTTGQVVLFLEALGAVDATDRRAFHDAARATLVSDYQEIDAFEAAFARFWRSGPEAAQGLAPSGPAPLPAPFARTFTADAGLSRASRESRVARPPADIIDRRLTWSAVEVLRRKRFDQLDADEARMVRTLMRRVAWQIEERHTRRFRRAAHGTWLDWRRMVQRAVRDQGEWLERRWRVRRTALRPLVVLADISGSMESYSRILLFFLHAVTQHAGARRGHRVEAFVFATRLTRITRALRHRDANLALAEVAERVVDWEGGTRIGECLHTFNRDWARQMLRHGAVVLVISDAWDRGDPDRLGREVDRLHRSCHRLVWLNPLIATPGFEPRTRGLVAALPFIDDFLPAHNLASLEDLVRHLARLP